MHRITKPTFVIDKAVCMDNIGRMAEKAAAKRVRFRPHFKTHQSAVIGNWFRDFGVTEITVSSVSMARYFARHGWNNITVAFPVNLLEMDEINELSGQVELNILVENVTVAMLLKKNITARTGIYIEIDTGYFRSGVEVNRVNQVDEILSVIKGNKNLFFRGFLTHNGQSYSSRSVDEIRVRHADSIMKMRALKKHYSTVYPDVQVSMGDTPSCSVCDNFDDVDEIRPGNFVFYDLMQEQLGACSREDIGVRMVCPVVSRHISRNEFVIYGGAVHLSKEFIINASSKRTYGAIGMCSYGGGSMAGEQTWVCGLSQEHGIIRSDFDDIKEFRIGGLTEVIPVHSCLTADLAGYYLTTDGEVIEKMCK